MDAFTMVAVIVVTVTVGGMVNNYLKSRSQDGGVSARDELEAELDELRARVEVLEKIVTEERYDLRREIDALEER